MHNSISIYCLSYNRKKDSYLPKRDAIFFYSTTTQLTVEAIRSVDDVLIVQYMLYYSTFALLIKLSYNFPQVIKFCWIVLQFILMVFKSSLCCYGCVPFSFTRWHCYTKRCSSNFSQFLLMMELLCRTQHSEIQLGHICVSRDLAS